MYAAAPGPFDFLVAHFVNRLVDELNDVKLIEGARRPGPMLTHASLVACRHIHTDRADVLGTGARSLERIGKLGHDLRIVLAQVPQRIRGTLAWM